MVQTEGGLKLADDGLGLFDECFILANGWFVPDRGDLDLAMKPNKGFPMVINIWEVLMP